MGKPGIPSKHTTPIRPKRTYGSTRQIMYVQRNIEVRSCNHCCSGKAVSITQRECVCVCVCVYSLRYPASNAHVPYYHLWPAPLYNIFPHYLIYCTIFGKKSYQHKMRVLIFSTVSSETLLILRRHERDVIKMYIGLHVKHRYSSQILIKL